MNKGATAYAHAAVISLAKMIKLPKACMGVMFSILRKPKAARVGSIDTKAKTQLTFKEATEERDKIEQ